MLTPLITLISSYRTYVVVRRQDAIDVFVNSWIGVAFRRLSIVLMVTGILGSASILFLKPITIAIFKETGDNGIAFFVTGVFLYLIAITGIVGVLMFEIIRSNGAGKKG